GAGDDVILGQQGNDRPYGDDGDDDIIGGHNVLGGDDGDHTIHGGAGADVLIGDNGLILRERASGDWRDVVWLRDGDAVNAAIRNVVTFELMDGVAGNDTIHGEAGEDRIWGQSGDDRLFGGDGVDEIIGGLGNDRIEGGAGGDYLLGGLGQILRARDAAGRPVLNSDGSWHRDVVLLEAAQITAMTAVAAGSTLLADLLASADVVLMAGRTGPTGAGVTLASGLEALTAIGLSLDTTPDDDVILGGTGNDYIFGQRGDDALSGDEGDDWSFGDTATNTTRLPGDLAQVASGYVLNGGVAGVNLSPMGTVVIPAATLLPVELQPMMPRASLLLETEGFLGTAAATRMIPMAGGAGLEVLAALVPDLRTTEKIWGNDVIDGGAGWDMILGDDAQITSLAETGSATLDTRLTALSVTMRNLMTGLASLNHAADLAAGRTGAIRAGNDTIRGGEGNDRIFGDTGLVLVPADRWSVTGADLETALSGVLDRVNRLEAAFESLTLAAYDSATRVLGGR